MKCPCGYVYEPEWNRDSTYEGGQKEFINIEGSFHIQSSGWHHSEVRVCLKACPECGTVKMVD